MARVGLRVHAGTAAGGLTVPAAGVPPGADAGDAGLTRAADVTARAAVHGVGLAIDAGAVAAGLTLAAHDARIARDAAVRGDAGAGLGVAHLTRVAVAVRAASRDAATVVATVPDAAGAGHHRARAARVAHRRHVGVGVAATIAAVEVGEGGAAAAQNHRNHEHETEALVHRFLLLCLLVEKVRNVTQPRVRPPLGGTIRR